MVAVSESYKNNIYAAERKTNVEVSFEIIDVEIYDNAIIYANKSEPLLSRIGQIHNKVREMTNKYATLEKDYFLLDGSFRIPPRYDQIIPYHDEVGWWGADISDEFGKFVEPPLITFTLNELHSAIGLSVSFDIKTNEYAKEFYIDFFNDLDEIIYTDHVTDNDKPLYIMDKPINDFKKVEIRIIKWANPFRRARIVEIDFGIIRYYEGDKIINLNLLEEMDLLASVVPSNEVSFTIDNSDQEFNILNPKGFYGYLKENQEIRITFGLEIAPDDYERIPMGKYYLQEWTVDEGAMTSTFIARDIFSSFELIEYPNLLENVTLYELATRIFSYVNFKDYIIDDYLKDYTTKGFKEVLSVRAALQLIAMASKSVLRQDRNGFIVIKRFEPLTTSTGYVTFIGDGVFTGTVTPQVDNDYSFNRIGFDNAFEIPQITLNPNVAALKFKIHHHQTEEPNELTVYNAHVKSGITYEIDNPCISTDKHALEVAEWCFIEYNIRHHYDANWRQNPAIEVGSPVVIEDAFGELRKSRITRSEFNFEGALDGMTQAIGGI